MIEIDPIIWRVLARVIANHDHHAYRRIFVCGSFWLIRSSPTPIVNGSQK